MKRTLWISLALTLLTAVFCCGAALGEGGSLNGDITWELSNGTLSISGTGAIQDYTPDNPSPFTGRSDIEEVWIGYGITHIGDYLLQDCHNLSDFSYNASLESVGDYAFYGAGLTEMNLRYIDAIGDGAFANCDSLISVILPEGFRGNKTVGDFAFSGCDSLRHILIGQRVASVGDSAFAHCEGLESVIVMDRNTLIGSHAFYGCPSGLVISGPAGSGAEAYAAQDGFEFKAITTSGWCGDNVTWSVNNEGTVLVLRGYGPTWSYPGENPDFYVYHDTVTDIRVYDDVTTIGNWLFYDMDRVTDISIENAPITSIGRGAFQNCVRLRRCNFKDWLEISPEMTSIGQSAFAGCSALSQVKVYSPDVELGDNAFRGCAGALVISGFQGSTAQTYAQGHGVTFNAWPVSGSCGPYASWSYDTSSRALTVAGTGAMRDYVWNGSPWFPYSYAIRSVTVGHGITRIGAYAFRNCDGVTFVTLPDTLAEIGDDAFEFCQSLPAITIPASVTTIGDYAFSYCESLAAVTIPMSVTSIGRNAFLRCYDLRRAVVLGADAAIGEDAFSILTMSHNLTLCGWPGSTAETYAQGDTDIVFEALAVPDAGFFLPSGLIKIDGDAFAGIKAEAVVIPKSTSTIVGNPFAGSGVWVVYGYTYSAAETFAERYG